MSHADALVRVDSWIARRRPDVVVQIGQPAASKVLGQWVASSGAEVVAIDPDGWWFDPDRVVSQVVRADPAALASGLVARLGEGAVTGAEWLDGWIEADRRAARALDVSMADHGLSEPAVARAVLGAVPDGGTLVVASSMPVRDVEWYGEARRGARVLSNRGANGIDGVVSTAVGVSLAGVPTVALVGDVAFLHDTNALLGLAAREVDLTVVVVDNDGGGIFSFLPQAAQLGAQPFEQLFGTPHGVDVTDLASAHGVDATVADSASEVAELVAKGGLRLVVVRTERRSNVEVHDQLHAAVARALS